ncbi:MAG: hypothetical protein F6J97_00100 [Leptolyngbya sp. SIO4C1]|nr:hypothetical protein [Leptolyngbya sp. SIO4C1]
MPMHPESIQIFRMLIEAGAEPGRDFSCDLSDQTVRLTERGFILLQNAYPGIDWPAITEVTQRDIEGPVQQLEADLGVNFVERMLQAVQQQLELLPAAKAAWYLQQVMSGVERRTGVALYHCLLQRFPEAQPQVETLLEMADAEPCNDWICDLILAAGGTEQDCEIVAEDVFLSETGMERLNTVWTGEYELHEAPSADGPEDGPEGDSPNWPETA